MSSFRNTDILIIGSGLSGLSAALMLPDNLKITLITKTTLDECSTSWAQGGIASVLSNDDKFDIHIDCLLYTSPSPRDQRGSRMPSSA